MDAVLILFSLELDGLWITVLHRLKTSPVSFSVLIPNYNHAAYLPECLDSVVSQSCQPDAIYVIDDASTDNSVEVIRSYVQRFPHVHLTPKSKNRGRTATTTNSCRAPGGTLASG
jgi:cellulose synthase/poly-beta-1,6-N-acetylglucosamine synthase-like glycosyltransferase